MFLNRLSILTYHRVLPEPDPLRPGDIDASTFERHMKAVSRVFDVVPLQSAIGDLSRGEPKRGSVAITFDDGYADNATVALPILRKLGLTATFFIASDYLNGGRMWNDTVIEAVSAHGHEQLDLTGIGLAAYPTRNDDEKRQAADSIISTLKYLPQPERDAQVDKVAAKVGNRLPADLMMTTEQLRQLSEAGMTIGGHTASHPILARLDDATAFHEIQENKRVLHELCGQSIELFAYPNGKPNVDYETRHVDMLRRLDFKGAVSTRWGTAGKSSDPYQLPRFTPWDRSSLKYVLRLLAHRWRDD